MNLALRAGRIVLADWRPALSKEPGRLRPAILDSESFGPAHPGGVLVPITGDVRLGIATPSAPIPPSATNGCIKPFFALATHVTAASTSRIRPTESTITPDQLAAIRARIGIALGL